MDWLLCSSTNYPNLSISQAERRSVLLYSIILKAINFKPINFMPIGNETGKYILTFRTLLFYERIGRVI